MSLLADAATVDLPLPLPPPAPLVRGREYRVRLLLLGASCAGKTCLRLRFTEGTFPPERRKSADFDFSVAKLEVDGVGVNVQVRPPPPSHTHTHTLRTHYDPPLTPRRHTLHTKVYDADCDCESGPGAVAAMCIGRSCDGIVAVIDVTNKATLEAFEPSGGAAQAIRERPGIARVLVGAKCDGDRKVTRAEGEGVAQRLGMRYIEASALTGAGVREAFDAAIRSAGEHCLLRLSKMKIAPPATMMHRSSGFIGRNAPPCPCDCCVV